MERFMGYLARYWAAMDHETVALLVSVVAFFAIPLALIFTTMILVYLEGRT